MIWKTFAVSTQSIADDLWVQYGALGLIIIGLAIALIYYVRKYDKLSTAYDALQEKRIEEIRAASQASAVPFQELTRFVGTLYEQSIKSNGN